MSDTVQWPREKSPEEILQRWADAYREGPAEHRFPSDPDAEFFPVDMERGAQALAALREQNEKLKAERKIVADNLACGPANIVEWSEKVRRALEELDYQNEQIEKMQSALGPFADVDGVGNEDFDDKTTATVEVGRLIYYGLTLGDFRRARAALPSTQAENK